MQLVLSSVDSRLFVDYGSIYLVNQNNEAEIKTKKKQEQEAGIFIEGG